MKCKKCGTHIHSSRELCNKCAGVTDKAVDAPEKTKGAMVEGKWESGRNRAARLGMDELRGMV